MKPQGRLGDPAFCPADSHACPIGVHPVIGPAIKGSADVHVNSRPALRDGDPGVHFACCGSNTWKANGGSSTVIINGRKAFRRTDPTKHCGGTGKLVIGSSNVLVGDNAVSPQVAAMRAAAARGVPFCEECERKRKALQEDEAVPDPPPEMLSEVGEDEAPCGRESAPIKIPDDVKPEKQPKVGYDQVRYRWSDGQYKYEVRWHTRTPGAPLGQGPTWVVERITSGKPDGTRSKKHVLLADGRWATGADWYGARRARKEGRATAEQNALLDSGHHPE